MKRFWSFKRGEQFFVGCSKLTKTGSLGCADAFGNLYLVLPWTKFCPAIEGIATIDNCVRGCSPRAGGNPSNIHGT